ncbi:hypothetical protein [Streptomyces sp. NPDC059761]|uniref:hypothetical protein n=1 Tax=Streptomyces sp. NPDC059761 TaxID=3346937 RepID=UPI00364D0C16
MSLVAAAGNAASAASYGLLVLLAQEELGVSDTGYGVLLAAARTRVRDALRASDSTG